MYNSIEDPHKKVKQVRMKKYMIYQSCVVMFFLVSCKPDHVALSGMRENANIQENVDAEAYVPSYVNKELDLNGFVNWYKENENLHKKSEAGEFNYILNYLPSESMALLELRREKYDIWKFKKTCESYSHMLYFNFKIELNGSKAELLKYNLKDPGQYEQRVKYISFEMQKDIYIEQNGQEMHPDMYQFERIFNVAPYCTVMMAFDRKKINPEKDITLVYNDKLFDKGIIKFHFKEGQLTDLPKVTGL
jgi:hypothetical protein